MDVRGGVNYYHNVADSEGDGLTTSADVGIPGANIDDWTSGLSQITINNGYTNPLVGFSNSLPWDRSEKTWNVAATLTKLQGNHTIKFGGEWRHNRDFLLQTQDAGGPRGQFIFSAAGTGLLGDNASLGNLANSFAAFLLDWPNTVQRDLRVLDPGTKHWATFAFVHDKWQLRPNITVDLGLRWEFYTPLVGLEDQGGLSNYDVATQHAARGRLRQHAEQPGREEQLQALQSAHGHLVAHQRADGRPCRLRRQHDSVPRQPVRVQLPGEAEQRAQLHQPVPARGHDGDRVPDPVVRAGAVRRDHPRHRIAAEQHLRRHSERACTRRRCTRGTWPCSGSCRGTSRQMWPMWATVASIS